MKPEYISLFNEAFALLFDCEPDDFYFKIMDDGKYLYTYYSRPKQYTDTIKAYQLLSKIIKSRKADYYTYLLRGLALIEIGNLQNAIRDLERAERKNPNLPYAHFLLGNLYKMDGYDKDGIDQLSYVVDYDPFYPLIHQYRGRFYYDDCQYEKSAEDLEEALKNQGESEVLMLNLMHVYDELGDTEQVVECCNKVLEFNKDYHYAPLLVGDHLLLKKDYIIALKWYGVAIDIKKDDVILYSHRSCCLMNMDRWEEAISDLDSIIQIEPENAEAWKNRGFAKLKLKDFQNAIPDFKHSLEYCLDEDLSAYNYLGICYFGLGEFEEAYENFEKFLFYFPNDESVKTYQRRCLRMLKLKKICNKSISV